MGIHENLLTLSILEEMLMPGKLLYAAVSVAIIVSALLVGYYFLYRGSNQTAESWKAAIVDQLSIDENLRNATFVDKVTSILNSAGYNEENISGQEVDVKFYENLPSKGYKVIILRVHSTVRQNSNFVDLFTSEPYVEDKYPGLGDQISRARFFYGPQIEYFAIGPTFVRQSMKGNFANATIILMGCSGLNYTTMAEELKEKGARVIVGWTTLIEPSETDHYTTVLLQHLLNITDPSTVKEAVYSINLELSQRPTRHGSLLRYYPTQEENYIIPIKKEGETAATMKTNVVFQILIRDVYDDFQSTC